MGTNVRKQKFDQRTARKGEKNAQNKKKRQFHILPTAQRIIEYRGVDTCGDIARTSFLARYIRMVGSCRPRSVAFVDNSVDASYGSGKQMLKRGVGT